MSPGPALGLGRGSFRGWDAWRIRRGPLDIVVVPAVGGRIMGLIWRDRQLAFVHPELAGRTESDPIPNVSAHKRERSFLLWGGDKTWLAPQDRWLDELPFFDLDSCPYEIDAEEDVGRSITLRLTSSVCRESGMRIARIVTVHADQPGWQVIHRLENAGRETARWGIWIVSMIRRPGRVYLPRSGDSRHPGGLKIFAHEGDSTALCDEVVTDHGTVFEVDCTQPRRFKYGVDAKKAAILAVIEPQPGVLIGHRKSVPTFHPEPYGHDCVAEVFNAAEHPYFELELLGPVVALAPGETFEIVETAEVFDLPARPELEDDIRDHLFAGHPS